MTGTAAAPPDVRVYVAPLDATLSERPLLCVELLSPGTRRHDLAVKRGAYERAGVLSYWIIDPLVPSLVALELRDDSYVEVARVEGAQAWTATAPYAVTVVPADLLR